MRVYHLDEYEQDKARLGRLFRCTTFMVNAFYDFDQPRPGNRMSPHFHDDFEQVSLTLAGDLCITSAAPGPPTSMSGSKMITSAAPRRRSRSSRHQAD